MITRNGTYTVEIKDPITKEVHEEEVHFRTNAGQVIGLSDGFKGLESFTITRNANNQITQISTDTQVINITYDSTHGNRLDQISDSSLELSLRATYDIRGRFTGLEAVNND